MSLLESKRESFIETAEDKFIGPKRIAEHAKELKAQGKKIVTLNGSFDLLHPGHFEMIYQAATQGDVLWMLLNSDSSIKQYKSPDRPINPLRTRLLQMAALFMVDYVSWFDETDPIRILGEIGPQVHANGSEYGENCIEADVVRENGGRIHIVKLIDGFSTTNLIKKIQSLCD